MSAPTHYQPSEQLPVRALVGAAVATLLLGLVVAPLYALAIVHVDVVQLNILLTILFGVFTGVGIRSALRRGGIESRGPGLALVFAGAVVIYWLHWVFWFFVLADKAGIDASPEDWLPLGSLWAAMVDVYRSGTWGLSESGPLTGPMLGVVWATEMAGFFGLALLTGNDRAEHQVRCQPCRQWCEAQAALVHFDPEKKDELAAKANAQQWSALVLPSAPPGMDHFEVVFHRCPGCEETQALSLRWVEEVEDHTFDLVMQATVLADRVLITDEDALELRRRLGELREG